LCFLLAAGQLKPYAPFHTADAEVWAHYPARTGAQTAVILAADTPPWAVEPPESAQGLHPEILQAADKFDLHRLKRAQLAHWETAPGLDIALTQLRRMRPRRRGWWGTGPAAIPRLAVHPEFAERAQAAAQLLPESPDVQEWARACRQPATAEIR